MKRNILKKILLCSLFVLLLSLCACNDSNNDNNNDEPNTDPIIPLLKGIKIDSEPERLDFYYDEEIDYSGLKVSAVYDNNVTKEINDYEIIHDDLVLGDNTITIKKEYYIACFIINIHDYERINIKGHLNFYDKTLMKYTTEDATLVINDIQYGGNRTKDTFVVYDEENRIQTNIYGYEVAVDKYGKVVDSNINVTLPEGGYVLSAHGTRVADLKTIKLNDFVVYDEVIYIFKDESILKSNELFLSFYNLLNDINDIESNKEYNNVVTKINEVIPSLNSIYKEFNEDTANELIIKMNSISDSFERFDWTNHTHTYNYKEFDCNGMVSNYQGTNKYTLINEYECDIIYGGFREKDRLAYYDNEEYYRDRNNLGYEVAIDKNGYVIAGGILVTIPDKGFILSGHGIMADYLRNNIEVTDKIEIVGKTIYIYRDVSLCRYNKYISLRNDVCENIKKEIDKQVPHDYEYISLILNKIDTILNNHQNETNVWISQLNRRSCNLIDTYIGLIEANLLDNLTTIDKGFWYCPFSNGTRDDNIENIQKAMQEYKEMGITELIVSPYYQDKLVYKSNIYKSHEYENVYGEYGCDYLACLIGEAHKVNIKINMFTATFRERISSMLVPDESLYQLDYNGDRSLGGTNYYDICNDNVQKLQIDWYKEMVSNYDIDKLEYDIIRYPSNNLHNYLDVETIPSTVSIIDHGYTEYSMNKFMTSHGYTGDLKQLIRDNKKIRNEWFEFQTAGVNDFVKNSTAALKEINKDLIITAAVFNNWVSAEKSVHQCYHLWLDNGWIDQAEPMMYTAIIDEFIDMIDMNYDEVYGEYIRAGIGARLDEYNYYKDFLELKLSEECNGYIMYRAGYYLKDANFIRMMKMNHHNITIKNLEYEEKKKAAIDDMIDMVKSFYSVRDSRSYKDLLEGLNTYDIDIIKKKLNAINNNSMKEYLMNYLNEIN